MIIVNTPPKEIYRKAKELWGVDFENTVFTVGDKIHTKHTITYDLLAHEEKHSRQQKECGVNEWWDRYFKDPKFRLQQELEAYQEQYRSVVLNVSDRNEQARALFFFATSLSGDMYGRMIPYQDAVKKIRNGK